MKNDCNMQGATFITPNEIHSSWIEGLPSGKLIKKLFKETSTNTKLTEYIDQSINIDVINWEKISNTEKIILKSSSKVLRSIILKAGAAQFSKRLSRIISQQEVNALRRILGDDIYHFSLHEAPLSFPKLLKAENTLSIIDIDHLHINAVNAGYRSLKIALEKIPNNCFLKLPKQWEETYLIENRNKTIKFHEHLLHMDLIFSLFEQSPKEPMP